MTAVGINNNFLTKDITIKNIYDSEIMMIKNKLSLIFVAIIVILLTPTVIQASESKPYLLSPLQDITQTSSGKWLVTISIGRSYDAPDAILALRNLLLEVFTSSRGGNYSHNLDIHHLNSSVYNPTKNHIFKEINNLKRQIEIFKNRYPYRKTSVVLGITGHGISTSNGHFSMMVHDGRLYGNDIVQIVEDLGVDETLVFMQSCQSGSVTNKHFPENFLNGFTQDIYENASLRGVSLSVLAPVDQKLNSPFYKWEDILRSSFLDDSADINNDKIVSYEEWKNSLLKNSCQSPYYFDISKLTPEQNQSIANPQGINPQFYEYRVNRNMPMFLTKPGLYLEGIGSLFIPNQDFSDSIINKTTDFHCESKNKFHSYLFSEDIEKVASRIKSFTDNEKLTILNHMERVYVKHKFFDLLVPMFNGIAYSSNSKLREELIYFFAANGPTEKYNADFDKVINYYISRFNNETTSVQIALAHGFAEWRSKNSLSTLVNKVFNSNNLRLKIEIAQALKKFQDTKLIPTYKKLLYNQSPQLRIIAIQSMKSLSFILGPDDSTGVIDRLHRDPVVDVRVEAAKSLEKIGINCKQVTLTALRKSMSSDTSSEVRSAAKKSYIAIRNSCY